MERGRSIPKGLKTNRRRFLAQMSAGAMLLVAGASQSGQVRAKGNDDTPLRVMQWNIWRSGKLSGLAGDEGGEKNLEQLIEFIRWEEPDVICMVETYGSGETIVEGLNEHVPEDRRYTGMQVTREPGQKPGDDNLWLFSRYPIVEEFPLLDSDKLTSFGFGGARIQLPSGRQVNVFSSWLYYKTWAWGYTDRSALDIEYGLPRTYTDEEIIGTDYYRRYDQARVILDEWLPAYLRDPNEPTIICGDFNTMSHIDWSERFASAPGHMGLVLDWPATRAFEEAGFIDTYRQFYPDASRFPGSTWSPYWGFGLAPGRIDFAFIRGDGLRVLGSHTHTERLQKHANPVYPFYSDHGTVVSDLLIRGGGGARFGMPRRERDRPYTPPAQPEGRPIPQEKITATATSEHVGYEAARAIDGDPRTMWHSEWDPKAPLPQSITLNLGDTYDVTALTYQARITGYNGSIYSYNVYVSIDGERFQRAASGNLARDRTRQVIPLNTHGVHYVRLEALQGFGDFASAAEIEVYERIK